MYCHIPVTFGTHHKSDCIDRCFSEGGGYRGDNCFLNLLVIQSQPRTRSQSHQPIYSNSCTSLPLSCRQSTCHGLTQTPTPGLLIQVGVTTPTRPQVVSDTVHDGALSSTAPEWDAEEYDQYCVTILYRVSQKYVNT
jgi:hypothetical protein